LFLSLFPFFLDPYLVCTDLFFCSETPAARSVCFPLPFLLGLTLRWIVVLKRIPPTSAKSILHEFWFFPFLKPGLGPCPPSWLVAPFYLSDCEFFLGLMAGSMLGQLRVFTVGGDSFPSCCRCIIVPLFRSRLSSCRCRTLSLLLAFLQCVFSHDFVFRRFGFGSLLSLTQGRTSQ